MNRAGNRALCAGKGVLEGLGYRAKGEIGGCDLVALKDGDPPVVVIAELKMAFTLELVLQGVDRARAGEEIWLAARLAPKGPPRRPPVPRSVPAAGLWPARRARRRRR